VSSDHRVYNAHSEAVVSQQKTDFDFPDNYGNVSGFTSTTSSATQQYEVTEGTSVPYNDPDKWIIGLITHQEEDSTRNGRTIHRSSETAWDFDRRLVIGAERFGTDQGAGDPSRITNHDRDEFGNITTTCTAVPDLEPRCTSVLGRDAQNIHPSRVRDAEGLESEILIGAEGGELLATVDPNLIPSERAFDAFGRLQQVQTPTERSQVAYEARQPSDTVFQGIRVYGALAIRIQAIGIAERTAVYDAFGRLVETKTPALGGSAILQEREYGVSARLTHLTRAHEASDASEGFTTFSYDILGRLTQETRADGTVVDRAYTNNQAAGAEYATLFTSETATIVRTTLPRSNTRGRPKFFLDHFDHLRSPAEKVLVQHGAV
jgi:YD repeat-containing protein